MTRDVPEIFEREQGCTEAEWLRWLPGAVGAHRFEWHAPGRATVAIGEGRLHLDWVALEPRRIALIRMPRLRVGFRFEDLSADERAGFLRYFDLYLQRGGG